MKLNVKKILIDLNGDALGGDSPMSLADVLTTALLSAPHPQGSVYPADQTVKRYDLALAINTARKAIMFDQAEVEITADIAALLKADINRLYGPIVAGQVLPMLDGK
jgi:hypothetical protein